MRTTSKLQKHDTVLYIKSILGTCRCLGRRAPATTKIQHIVMASTSGNVGPIQLLTLQILLNSNSHNPFLLARFDGNGHPNIFRTTGSPFLCYLTIVLNQGILNLFSKLKCTCLMVGPFLFPGLFSTPAVLSKQCLC